jgi:SMI1/KNR4 family protein SUKH-1
MVEGTRNHPESWCSDDSLGHFEALLGIRLPDDLVTFYKTADGMPEYVYDQYQVSFWSIDHILKETAMNPPISVNRQREIPFADFMIESYRYVLRVTGGELRVGFDFDTDDEEVSLEGFFRRYLERPDSISPLGEPRASSQRQTVIRTRK